MCVSCPSIFEAPFSTLSHETSSAAISKLCKAVYKTADAPLPSTLNLLLSTSLSYAYMMETTTNPCAYDTASRVYTFQCMCVLVKRVSIYVLQWVSDPTFSSSRIFSCAKNTSDFFTSLHPTFREILLLHLNFLDWIITLYFSKITCNPLTKLLITLQNFASLMRDFKHKINLQFA